MELKKKEHKIIHIDSRSELTHLAETVIDILGLRTMHSRGDLQALCCRYICWLGIS